MKRNPLRSQTGIPGLDDILHGGFLAHQMYLIEGDPGAGKTTLALQFLLAGVSAGEKCLYVTLSETKEELEAGARSHGWSLQGIKVAELIADDESLAPDGMLTMYNPSEMELSETTKKVLDLIRAAAPSRVVFDSLSEMRLLAQSSLRYRRQVLALKQFFVGRKCTVLMLDDGTAEGADTQLQSIAHGVVTLEQLSPEYGGHRRRVRIKKLRGTNFRGGYHDYSITGIGLQVFPRLVAAEHGVEFEREKTASGITALDELLGGGVDRGTSTLLIGPAGSGKTTVATQYAVAAANRGDRAIIFAFDENSITIRARMRGLGIGLDATVKKKLLEVRQIDPAELSPGEFAHQVRLAVERDGVKIVVIDTLNGYMMAMPDERFLTAQLHELLSYLALRGVTTFMVVAQHGMVGASMGAPVDTSYLADSVVLFRYFENKGRVKKAISVMKKRSGPHEQTIRELFFDQDGVHLSEPLVNFHGILTGVPIETK